MDPNWTPLLLALVPTLPALVKAILVGDNPTFALRSAK